MVFESLVVELINRFVGDYVENLDASQLKLGIWGGDAVLQNLDLKESALDDLDLPVKIKAGHVAKITLKIPWKNLYTEPVIAEIDGIYALAVPNAGIKYNAEKEEKNIQEAKQKKLKEIEEMKKAEAEKDQPKEAKDDTFAEKMATQVIKNLQVKVTNIHVRYEDQHTNPKRPFAIGLTLKELLFQTTDDKWVPMVIKETVIQIHKLIRLDSLGVYWNSKTVMYNTQTRSDILNTLKKNVGEGDSKTDYQYCIKPISSVAHLKLNTKPEQSNFSLPKIFLTVVFDNIGVALSKLQYDDVLEMLESFERMGLLAIYRKYKPDVALHNNAKQWWHYAYNAVLEETVRRRRKMWSWEHIHEHRTMMKKYRENYISKLESRRISNDLQKQLDEGEKYLDVFNITLMRNQAEVEAAKRGALREQEKGGGWFGGWFGGGKAAEKSTTGEIQEKFYEQFTAEEKAKLYGAIGYEENESHSTLPKEYIAVRLVTKLSNVSISLMDSNKQEPQILKLKLKEVFSSIGQRPAANAVHLEAKIDSLSVLGTQQDGMKPKMVKTQKHEKNVQLLDVDFETNPLDGQADTRVKLTARPLEIVFDAGTVNKLAVFFRPPESVRLKQLSMAAMETFDDIKEQSTAGLQLAIEQRKYTDISVHIMSSHIIVPEGGVMKPDVRMLVLDIGTLDVSTEKSETLEKGQSLESVMSQAYDKFHIELKRTQLMFVNPGDDWQAARHHDESKLHIIHPITVTLNLHKCMIDKDPRMARMKVFGDLPDLSVSVSDYRLLEILSLVQSIPLPEPPPPEPEENEIFKGPSDMVMVKADDKRLIKKASKLVSEEEKSDVNVTEKQKPAQTSSEFTNFIDLEARFELAKIAVTVKERVGDEEKPLLYLTVLSVGAKMMGRTFDMVVEAHIGDVKIQHPRHTVTKEMTQQLDRLGGDKVGAMITLVGTPRAGKSDMQLLKATYIKANKKGPEFESVYNKTEQSITIVFAGLDVMLHSAAILSLMAFAQKVTPPTPTSDTSLDAPKEETNKEEEVKEPKAIRKRREKPVDPDLIDIGIHAEMKAVYVAIATDKRIVSDIQLQGIDSKIMIQKAKTTVKAVLKSMKITDTRKDTMYPMILGVDIGDALRLEVDVMSGGTEGTKCEDMSNCDMRVIAALGQLRLVFLNKFVTDLLDFLDHFQVAKEKMKQAGDAVAEYSVEAAKNLRETASRVSLSIKMKAPFIIVPQNSTSNNVLIADLGKLDIHNVFQKVGRSTDNIAVVDAMEIGLSSLKLSRALMLNSKDVQSESTLLEPVTFKLHLTRNLSAAWFHDVSDIDVSGTLKAISFKISQGDFSTVMSVLNENLVEGQKQEEKSAVKSSANLSKKTTTHMTVVSVDKAKKETPVKEVVTTTTEVYKKIKFKFMLKSLSATLYFGDTKLTKGLVERESLKALAKFELNEFKLDGSIMSDNSMAVTVKLVNTILDDLRPSTQRGITRMICHSQNKTKYVDMINVTFDQNAKQDKNIDIGISSIYICLCSEFLMTVADFFTKSLPKSEPPVQSKVDVTKASKMSVKSVKETPKPVKETAKPPEGEMTIKLEMEKPEIIMIEDQLDKNTNSLLVDMRLMFKMRNTAEVQTMQATIEELQIAACRFSNREHIEKQVLQPCDVAFQSSAPFGKGHHMDINITDIVLNISPGTIRTLTAISTGFGKKQEEDVGTKKEKVPANLWDIKKLQDIDLWYLKTVVADEDEEEEVAVEEAQEAVEDGTVEEIRGEQMLLSLPSIAVEIEVGVEDRTVPLLIIDLSMQGEVKDWSSKLYVGSSLKLEVSYYNESLAVWEPLLEPIVEENKSRQWELGLEVEQNDDVPPPSEEGEDTIILPSPKMSISVRSADMLQLTISKTCLDVLQTLGKTFGDAYNLVEVDKKSGDMLSPYLIENKTGLNVILKLDPLFEPPANSSGGKVMVRTGENLPLADKNLGSLPSKASLIKASQEGQERKLIFQIEELGNPRDVTIKRVETRMFLINNKTGSDDWAVIEQTDSAIGQKVVSLRSIVQVCNCLTVPIEVHCKMDTRVELCGVAGLDSTFSVPLKAVYSFPGDLFFKPVDEYKLSTESLKWKAAENTQIKQFVCPSLQPGSSPFCFNIDTQIENVYFESGTELTAKSYILNIRPTVILHNLLPFPVCYSMEGDKAKKGLNKGENTALLNAAVNESTLEILIPDYMGREFSGSRSLKTNVPELSAWTFETHEGTENKTMDLGLYCKMNNGSLDVSLYSPYWMINKTGQTLCYRGGDADPVYDHPAEYEGIVLFAFKARTLFGGKKKAQLRIGNAEWSDKFSLDTVNCAGTVQCKSEKRVFEVGVTNSLTHTGLTKMITFTPFYMLLNTAEYSILCSEVSEQDDWIEVVPGKCKPFWPEQTGKDLTLKAKVKDTTEATTPFLINQAHTTCMRLDNEYGGINVECVVTELAMVTTLSEYANGLAAVQIVNHFEQETITFCQKGVVIEHTLKPMETVLYTWDDALGTRELTWKCGDKEFTNDLSQDGLGDFFLDSDNKAYWVSFLDGMQRVLLVSQDLAIVTTAQQAEEFVRMDQEISVSLQGMGLSLVNNVTQSEVAFLGITSSGIIWEEKRKKFKAIKLKDSIILEHAYQKYLAEIAVGNKTNSKVHLENKMEVDFSNHKESIMMLKPTKRTLRRSFVDGIWLQYKTSPYQVQLHAKINRLQLDNQLTGAVFPTVIAPLPPPKSVAAESVPKPFTEVSLMQRKYEHSSVIQIKYFKVLIQEFATKVDQGFLNAILDLFAADKPQTRKEETTEFLNDCKQIEAELMDVVGVSLAQEQKNFYDYLHFSPIKIHLSFSLQGSGTGDGDKPTPIHSNVLNVFLQSVGVVLTDVQDVVFKLGYFERNHTFYSQSQLVGEMTRHYAGQAIKQMYVLVLGLDVLGNPFGLLRGLSEGAVDLFYEPYQGAIQGPEEFAEGLALGVRSLFGHAVGGAAGAVSRITGTLGKGIAALTLDDDYQKKRREQLNKRPATAREGFARGGKGLVMGVFDGVTGIVRKPMEGAKQEGVSGFFKGMGKGLVGVVTRPTSGVIDFASSSLDGIRRLAEMSDEIRRLRPPRRFHKDKILRPYNHKEAEGYAILHETEKGKYADTDEYVAHVSINKDGKLIFLVLTNRVMLAKRGEIFGSWDAEWTFTWDEIKQVSQKPNKGIEIILKEKEKKKFSFGSSVTKKDVHIVDPKLCEWIIGKIEEARARASL